MRRMWNHILLNFILEVNMEYNLITFNASMAIILLSLFSLLSKIFPSNEVEKSWYNVLFYIIMVVGLYFAMEFFKLIIYFNHS